MKAERNDGTARCTPERERELEEYNNILKTCFRISRVQGSMKREMKAIEEKLSLVECEKAQAVQRTGNLPEN